MNDDEKANQVLDMLIDRQDCPLCGKRTDPMEKIVLGAMIVNGKLHPEEDAWYCNSCQLYIRRWIDID